MTGLSTALVEASGPCGPTCGQTPCPACSPASCTQYQTDTYAGCCKYGLTWYETRYCTGVPNQNCYYTFATYENCPHLPTRGPSASLAT